MLLPQRPPAPPTEYLQINIGGFDPHNLLLANNNVTLSGYVGCIRGLKIGDNVMELATAINKTNNKTGNINYSYLRL